MGMFDRIICKQDLPGWPLGSYSTDTEFQTKSLDNMLGTYVITTDGRLTDERGLMLQKFNGSIVFYAWMKPEQKAYRHFEATFHLGRLENLTVLGDRAKITPYDAGSRAYLAGIDYSENPYTGPLDRESWAEGWLSSKGEEQTS